MWKNESMFAGIGVGGSAGAGWWVVEVESFEDKFVVEDDVLNSVF